MKIGQGRGLARQMLKRPVIAFDKGRRGHLDEVAEHQASGDEAFHGDTETSEICASSKLFFILLHSRSNR